MLFRVKKDSRSLRYQAASYAFIAMFAQLKYWFCNLIMMLLRARDNNIQSFVYIWLDNEKQNEFLKHPKINFKLIN